MSDFLISDYDYELPDERIAQNPVSERDNSKLLVFEHGEIRSDLFKNLSSYIPPDHLLVFNNTRVIRARLLFSKNSGAAIEIFCIEPLAPADYSQSFGSKNPVEWKCLVGNLKKWKHASLETTFSHNGKEYTLKADNLGEENDARRIRFRWNDDNITFAEVLEATGHIPLPPYIDRDDTPDDVIRYQTIYSSIKGSVAAPTAGLHFTDDLLLKLSDKGIKRTELTLHVGAGTFKPVKTENISEHEMHTEHFTVTKPAIRDLLEYINKIIAVGTTTCRTLESLYWLGIKVIKGDSDIRNEIFLDQWEPYRMNKVMAPEESLEALLREMNHLHVDRINASTRVIIMPGYEFQMMQGLVTNFHQPKSTLLLLVAAWIGNSWREIYDYALENDFRFLSYGDSSLLFR